MKTTIQRGLVLRYGRVSLVTEPGLPDHPATGSKPSGRSLTTEEMQEGQQRIALKTAHIYVTTGSFGKIHFRLAVLF